MTTRIATTARAVCCGLLLAIGMANAHANHAPSITSTPSPVAVIEQEYRYAATATDADGDSVSFTVATAPTGFAYDVGQHAFLWRPSAGQIGDQSVTLRASDAAGASTTQTFTLHVLDAFCPLYPIALSDSALASASVGQTFNQMPRGTGAGNYSWLTWAGSPSEPTLAQSLSPPGDSYTYVNPDATSDHRLDVGDWAQGSPGNSNGSSVRERMDALLRQDIVLPTWSSNRGQGNNFDYRVQRFARVRLTDYRLTGQGWLSFEFRGFTRCYNRAPTATALNLATDEDTALSVALSGTDADGDALTYETTSTPQHGTLTGTAPQLTYTPANDYNGEDGFDYRVSDGELQSAVVHVRITVRPVNDPPTADNQQLALDEDGSVNVVLHGADRDGDTVTYVVDTTPLHGSISGTAPNLVYTPAANYNGTDTIRFHTHDGRVVSTLATVTLMVRPVNDAPRADDLTLALDEDSAAPLVLHGSDIDGDALSYVIDTPSQHGSVSGTAPNLVYTPAANYNGADTLRFHTYDGNLASATAMVTITVRPVNDAPAADNQALTLDEDSAAPLVLHGSDSDGDALTYVVDTPPQHGSLSGNAPNLVYTPAANYNGSDTLRFHSHDGSASSALATVTITVRPVNDAPIADDKAVQVEQGGNVAVVLSGSDIDGDALSFRSTDAPAHGSLSGTAPNLRYTANTGYSGSDEFHYVARDGALDSAITSVHITVTQTNHTPVITSTPVTTARSGSTYQYDVDATDADGDALQYSLISAPAGMTIDAQSGLIAWAPGASGSVAVSVRVSDGRGGTANQDFNVVVSTTNRPPVFVSQALLQATRGELYRYDAQATDPDQDVLAFNLDTAPSGMSVDAASGRIQWTPADNQVGTHAVRLRVSDGRGGEAVQEFAVTVIAVNRPPHITSVPVITGVSGTAYRYDVDANDPDAEALTYRLLVAPTGMTIDAQSGMINWLPNDDQLAAADVTVQVSDPHGASDDQVFRVIVNADLVGHSHVGREFWFTHSMNLCTSNPLACTAADSPDRSHWVTVAALQSAQGYVEIPGLSFRQDFTIPAGGVAEIKLPWQVMNVVDFFPRKLGVHVVTDQPVTVTSTNRLKYLTDSALIYPIEVLGTDYTAADYGTGTGDFPGGQISVLATQDNTRVTLLQPLGKHMYWSGNASPGLTQTLQRGEALMLESPVGYDTYSGAHIVSDKPVALFGGSPCARVPADVWACDHLYEQLLPNRNLGQHFLAGRLATRRVGNMYRFIATEDNTAVYANERLVAVLQAGGDAQRVIDGPVSINATKPIHALLLALGENADSGMRDVPPNTPPSSFGDPDGDLMDPFELALPPVGTELSDYLFTTPKVAALKLHYVSMAIPASATSGLVLDDQPVTGVPWQPIAGTNKVYGSLQVGAGRHRLRAAAPFQLFVYGYGEFETYGYTGGLLIGDQDRVRLLEVTPSLQSRTVGDNACFSVVARDAQRRRVPYARFLVRVEGQLPRAEAGYFDGTGRGEYCFSQPFIGRSALVFQSGFAQTEAAVDWLAATDGVNRAPVFISLPNLELREADYLYDAHAADPNGDVLRYELVRGPSGARIDAQSGALRWTPPVPDDRVPQLHDFVIRAYDAQGLYAEQSFDLQVHFPPRMTALSGKDATRTAHYDDTFSLFGDLATLHAELIEGPPGMSLFLSGRDGSVGWQPDSPALREADTLQLGARDGRADAASFATESLWNSNGNGIDTPVFGRLVDTNHDGTIDSRDRLVAVGMKSPGQLIARYVDTGEALPWPNTLFGYFYVVPAIADLDNDGKPEVVYSTGSTGTLSAIDGNGVRKWTTDPAYGTPTLRNVQTSIEIADLDGDGRVEIVAGGQVYGADGSRKWSFGGSASGAFHALISDLDGDGKKEVAFGAEVRRADGTLWWTLPSDGMTAPMAEWSAFDFDGDGKKEVLASSSDGRVNRLERFNASGTRLGTPIPLDTKGGMPLVFDIDRDGTTDIFLPWEQKAFTLDGTLRHSRELGPSVGALSLQSLADLNGDGAMDVLSGDNITDLQSGWLWARAQSTVATGVATRYGAGTLVDSNGDGNAELFIGGAFNTLERPVTGIWPMDHDGRSSLRSDAERYPGNFGVQGTPAKPADLRFDLWMGDLHSHKGSQGGLVFDVRAKNRGLAGMQQPVTVILSSGPCGSGGRELQRRTIAPLRSNASAVVTFSEVPRDQLQGWTYACAEHAETGADLRTDNNRVAAHMIDVRVNDGGLRADEQIATVQVKREGTPVTLAGTLPAQVYSGHELRAQVQVTANDPDHAPYFSLSNAPAGVRINPWTGVITWTPTAAQAGRPSFYVTATLFDGQSANLGLNTEVIASSNRPPQFTTTPSNEALVDALYRYAAQASDPDGDALSYTLTQSPTGMSIDATTGVVQWTPTLAQLGTYSVQVKVSDSASNSVTQAYSLVVKKAADTIPVFTSTPVLSAKVGRDYRYDVDAVNAGGTPLSYQLTLAPSGMRIDFDSGLITWTPTDAQVGPQRVNVFASTASGNAYANQSFTVQVVPRDAVLQLDLAAAPRYLTLGQTTQVTAVVSNAAGSSSVSATADGNALTLDATGKASYTPSTLGAHNILAQASDPYDTVFAQTTVYVSDPSDTQPPTVHLSAPADLSVITKPTAVMGTVDDAHLASWRLVLKDNQGATNYRTIASGTNTFSNASFATLDPTLLMNGLYILVLEATDSGGLVTTDSLAVSVEGAMKVGHFSVSFLDLEIPLSGIPIRVTRTYDTRRAHESLDFGYGWSVDYQNVSVRESRKLGYSWRLAQVAGGVTPWCVKPLSDPLVTVTLPDGSVEKFKARFEPECQNYVPTVYGSMVFEPVGNTHGTLEQLSYGTVRVVELGDGSSNIVNPDDPTRPADPELYRLTTAEGLMYTLDQTFGLRTVQDQAGNTLTYTPDGIRHSNGRGIGFERDAQQRISAITLPDGERLTYGYDGQGDLVSASDQLRHASTYAYQSSVQWPHYLSTITDPGRTVVARHEYDTQGRLIASVDANGKRQEYTHQLAGHVEQVKDRRGYTTTYVYDDNGWVLSETNPLNEQTLHTYDANGNELTTTDPLNRTTTRTFDARGNLLTETNPAHETITRTYGRYNQLLTQTDPTGRVVLTNKYRKNLAGEDTGFLIASTDGMNQSTYFLLDLCTDPYACSNSGNLTGIIDANAKARHFGYDGFGNLISDTDAMGHVTTRQVDAMGRVLTETQRRTVDGQAQELITRHEYDAAGHETKTTMPDGTTVVRSYNDKGQLQNEDHGLSRRTYDYTLDGRVKSVTYSGGGGESTVYDPEGHVIEQTDRLGARTKMVYDAAGRQTATIYADTTPLSDTDNPRVRQEYDAAGQLKVTWDEQNRPTEYRYDDAGRQTKVIDALAQERSTRYDALGRREVSVDARGTETRYVYDDAGRLIRTVLPDATADDGNPDNNPHVDVTYDAVGRKIAETDVQGRSTRYVYDAEGRLAVVILPNPQTGQNPSAIAEALSRGEDVSADIATIGVLVTRYGYDAQGHKTSQTDAMGRTTTWAYDPAGKVTRRTLPLGQSETFAYDSLGDRTSQVDFNGALTRHTYDGEHRLTRTDYADGSALTFTYDVMDRPLTLSYQGLTETRHYDVRGRLDQVKWSDGQQLDYTYDASGNRQQLNSGTRTVTFGYDELNRLQTISEAPSAALGQTGNAKVTTYAYDANGNRDHVLNANGTRVDYVYDRWNRLTNLTHKKAAAILLSLGYALNPDGTRAAIAEQVQSRDSQGNVVVDAQGAPVLQATRTSSYRYDATKRLIEEAVAAADANQRRTTQWTYDSVGNRLTQTQVVPGGNTVAPSTTNTTYRYDRNDRLLDEAKSINGASALTTTYRYDLSGNLLETVAPEATTTYRWNAQNRLVQAERKVGAISDLTQYGYTVDGIRRSSIAHANTAQAIETRSLIDPNTTYAQVIEERIGTPLAANGTYGSLALKAAYTVGDDRVSQYALRDANGNLLASAATAAVTSTFHADGLGSTRLLTDSVGNVVDQYAYHTFGERDDTASVLADPTRAQTDFQYTGEQFDPNLGWYYLRARYIDPKNGRFTQQDSWMGRNPDPITLHKYVYANSDPADYIDPSGNFGLLELAIGTDLQGVLRTTSTAEGRRALKRILFGHPPQDVGVVGELVLDWVLQGFYEHIQDGGITKQEFGQRVHGDLKNKCEAFKPIGGIRLVCEPFYDAGGREYGHAKKGTLGVDIMIYEGNRRVIGIEIKTGKGMSSKGFASRRKRLGTTVIQITLKGERG